MCIVLHGEGKVGRKGGGGGAGSVVDGGGIRPLGGLVLLWVLPGSAVVELAKGALASRSSRIGTEGRRLGAKEIPIRRELERGERGGRRDALYALLRPLEILLHFLGCAHSIGEVCARAREPALGEGLELEEFAVLCVEFAGSGLLSVVYSAISCAVSSRRSNCMPHRHRNSIALPVTASISSPGR